MGDHWPADPTDPAALCGRAPVLLTELFVNEDCEAKCIVKAKASLQDIQQ